MPITQQISCSAVFFFVFHQLVRDHLSPSTLMFGNVSAFLVGYLVTRLIRWRAPHALFDAVDSAEGSAGAVVAYVASMRADEKRRAAADSAATAAASANAAAPVAGGSTSHSNTSSSSASSSSSGSGLGGAASTASAVAAPPPSSSSSSSFASESFVAASSRPRVAAAAVAVMPPVGGDNGWAQLMRLCPPALLARVGAPALAFYRVCERVAIFCAVLHMLSPVLRTLTLSFSEDTITGMDAGCTRTFRSIEMFTRMT